MKTWLTILALAGLSPLDAAALKAPSATEFQEIEKLLDSAQIWTRVIDERKKCLAFNEADCRNKAGRAEALATINNIENVREDLREKAIRKTLLAYDILPADADGKPIRPEGVVVMGGDWKGRKTKWFVTSKENEARLRLYKTAGENIRETNDGITTILGTSVLFDSAFRDPKKLAMVLFHEKVHFEQFTTEGQGDSWSFDDMEVAAWEAEQNNAWQFGFSAQELKEHYDETVKRIDEYRSEARNKPHQNPYASRAPAYLYPHGEADLEEIITRAEGLDAIFAREQRELREKREAAEAERKKIQDAERRERELAEARRQAEPDRLSGPADPLAAPPGREKLGSDPADLNEMGERIVKEKQERYRQVQLSWDWLRGMSARVCADPSSLSPDDERTIHVAYNWLSRSGSEFNVSSPEAVAGDLTGCSKAFLLKIIAVERTGLAALPGQYRAIAVESAELHRPQVVPDQGNPGGDGGGDTERRGGVDRDSGRRAPTCGQLRSCNPNPFGR